MLRLCLSDALCQCGDVRKALSGYRRAPCVWREQRCPLPLIHSARLFVQIGQTDTARELLRQANIVDPSLSSVWTEMAQLDMQMRLSCRAGQGSIEQLSQAIDRSLEKALRLAKHHSEVLEVLTVRLSADIQLHLADNQLC